MAPPADTTSRFASYGRVSTEDPQYPSLSIPRQLAACERALEPAGGEIIAGYWDIESGRKALAERGRGAEDPPWRSPARIGLNDLLEAAGNGRPFDAVIVESIDRLSRMTADATRIERQLEDRDIALFVADEPMTANATAIPHPACHAEWYVRDLIEKSRRGMEESARQGWRPGPYG
jgi:site-specific DNA recombinase